MSRSRSHAFCVRQRPARALVILTFLSATAVGLAVSTEAMATSRQSTILVTTKNTASGGNYLVTEKGFTLYTFMLDSKNKSACTGACAALWPPFLVKKGTDLAKIEKGLKSSRLGEIKRSNGTLQLTYEGKPLYRFSGDKLAGQRKGQGFEHVWFVALVTPAASSVVSPNVPASTTPTTAATTNTQPASSPPATSPPATSPPPTSPPPTSPPPTTPPPTTPPTTQPGGGYGY